MTECLFDYVPSFRLIEAAMGTKINAQLNSFSSYVNAVEE